MNRTMNPFSRITTLATLALTLLLLTAGRAAAVQPEPGGPAATDITSDGGSVQLVAESSVSSLQWALFAAAVMAALVIGASVTHLAEQRRLRTAH